MRARNEQGRFEPLKDGLQFEGRRIYFDSKGYACIWLNGRDVKVHRLIWERAHGPRPLGHEIHHRDEDKANFSLSNLELLTNSNHQRLHAGWIKDEVGGWIAKPCSKCLTVLPLAEFYLRKGYAPSGQCKSCHILSTKSWGSKNPEKRREISRNYWRRKKGTLTPSGQQIGGAPCPNK